MTLRERTTTWEDPARALQLGAGLTGLEILQGIASGEIPPPPIAVTMGFDFEAVGEGTARFTLVPQEFHYNPIGGVHGGVIATLLDSVLGCAIHTTLPADTGYGTTDLHVRYLRGITVATGKVVAEARVTHRGRRLATADATLVAEASGKLLATATTSCLIVG